VKSAIDFLMAAFIVGTGRLLPFAMGHYRPLAVGGDRQKPANSGHSRNCLPCFIAQVLCTG